MHTKSHPMPSRRDILLGATALAGCALIGPRARALSIGQATLTTVSDGALALPAGMLIESVDARGRAALEARGLANAETLRPECNLALWQDGTHTVLFDAGAGPDFMPTTGQLLDSLDAAGVAPEDITHVLFTHAHPDHLWGVLDDFDEPLFYNAQHLMNRAERDFWLDPATVDRMPEDRLSFVAGALRRIETLGDQLGTFEPGDEVVSGIQAVSTPGHTPGHVAFQVASGTQSALVVGDAIGNDHVSFANPAWPMNSDQDKAQAAETRKALFDRIVADDLTLVGFHLSGGGLGRAEPAPEGGYRFVQDL